MLKLCDVISLFSGTDHTQQRYLTLKDATSVAYVSTSSEQYAQRVANHASQKAGLTWEPLSFTVE